MRYILLSALLSITSGLWPLCAASAQPVIDGDLGEWTQPLYTDAQGDGAPVDLGRFWATSDRGYLYLAFETGAEINLQSFNELVVYLDTDDNPATGQAVGGIGAELAYAFGQRQGTVTLQGLAPTAVSHAQVGLFSAPTVTADRFEVAFPRGITVGGRPVFTGPSVRIVLRDGSAGDALPDAPNGVRLALRDDAVARQPVALGRLDPTDLRVLTYNVLRDGLFSFQPQQSEAFRRIFQATAPDVVALQEVYTHSAADVAARLAELLPGTTWYAAGVAGSDVFVAARYPILETTPLCVVPSVPSTCNVAVRLDLRPRTSAGLYVVSMHPACCANDRFRQEDFDFLAAHIRDARASGALPAETPVVVAGDMNLVGDRRQVRTLLAGDIVDNARFGPDAPPDADGTPFADAAPLTTGRPADFTWINPSDAFPPGRLDYIVYSDALLTPANAFALYTPGLTSDELARHGLVATDTDVSDHLPLVQDFALRPTSAEEGSGAGGLTLAPPAPNPVRGRTTVRFSVGGAGHVRLSLIDPLGRTVRVVVEGEPGTGPHEVALDTAGLAPGVYLLRLDASGRHVVRRLTVAR